MNLISNPTVRFSGLPNNLTQALAREKAQGAFQKPFEAMSLNELVSTLERHIQSEVEARSVSAETLLTDAVTVIEQNRRYGGAEERRQMAIGKKQWEKAGVRSDMYFENKRKMEAALVAKITLMKRVDVVKLLEQIEDCQYYSPEEDDAVSKALLQKLKP